MHKSSMLSLYSHIRGGKYFLLLLAGMLVFPSIMLLPAPQVHAEAVPGGNVNNQVVRAVDIAKPAVVRIITTIKGRLTVHFNTQGSATFPLSGGYYNISLSGSGSFISANGDILTADHVIHPPHDKSLDQYLQMTAAKDVADYINTTFNPDPPYTEDDAFSSLAYGVFRTETSYATPKSEVYLSQDYTGPYNATRVRNVPANARVAVDRVELESPVDQKDVAIVHVGLSDTPSLQIGDSSNVAQQDELTIIGFPGNGDLGDPDKQDPNTLFTSSVNKIYVSSIKKGLDGQPLIQVGGNVEHGDSGGPALDSHGQVVGVVSFYSNNADIPIGTSFLQASQSAQELIHRLALDTKPGKFERSWQQAFTYYTATTPGHWHDANKAFKNLAATYPNFQAVNAFVDYTGQQAQHEDLSLAANSAQSSLMITLMIIIFIICVIFVAGVLFFVRRERKRNSQIPALATIPAAPGPINPMVSNAAQAHHYMPEPALIPAPLPQPQATPLPLQSFNSTPVAPVIPPVVPPIPAAPSYPDSHKDNDQGTAVHEQSVTMSDIEQISEKPTELLPDTRQQGLQDSQDLQDPQEELEQTDKHARVTVTQTHSEASKPEETVSTDQQQTSADITPNTPLQRAEPVPPELQQEPATTPVRQQEQVPTSSLPIATPVLRQEEEEKPSTPQRRAKTPIEEEELDDFQSWQGEKDYFAYITEQKINTFNEEEATDTKYRG